MKRHYIVGAVKIPYEDRDIAHAVLTPADDRGYFNIIGADDDDGHVEPIGANVTYRVELTDEEAELFRSASNCRYVELDGRLKSSAIPQEGTMQFMRATFSRIAEFHGRDVLVGLLDGGTTSAVRSVLGATMVNRHVLSPDDPGSDEITNTHGCLVAPCLIPNGGRFLDVIIADNAGFALHSNSTAGARWCADQGAKVVNFSYSATDLNSAWTDAMQYLKDRDVQFFSSAGNQGENRISYPAALSEQFPNCHSSIAFSEVTGKRAAFSNYASFASGCAPGDHVVGLRPDGSITSWNGTSASSPHMAQLCARGATGGKYTPKQVGAALKANTRNTGQPAAEQGHGAYSLEAALTALGAFLPPPAPPVTEPAPEPGEPTPPPTPPPPSPDPEPEPEPLPGPPVTEEVLRVLQGRSGRRTWRFRYELLTKDNIRVRDLDNVVGGSVANEFFAEIKRTAKFVIVDDGNINFLTHRIRPWAGVQMPDGSFNEWPLGVFLLTTPTRKVDISGVVTRDVEAYDQTIVLQDDTVPDRYFVSANYKYTDAIEELLSQTPGIVSYLVTPSSTSTATAIEWEPGTSKYQIISDLLSAINYGSLWFDGNGVARAEPYSSPNELPARFAYLTDDVSVILPEADNTMDLYSLPNRWVLIVSSSEQPPLRAEVINADPASPTSVPNRGRIITRVITNTNAPNQAMLNAIAERYRDETGQVYETVEFKTGLMPFHENGDVYDFEYNGFVGYGRFTETKWAMDLSQGAEMEHEARRAVSILGGYGTGPYGTMPYGG